MTGRRSNGVIQKNLKMPLFFVSQSHSDLSQNLNLGTKFCRIAFVILLAAVYVYLTTRYPIWNFDDIYLYAMYVNKGWDGIKSFFLAVDLPTEYRTYSFSRCFQFVLLKLWGNQPFPFYLLMAATHLASAFLLYKIISQLGKSSNKFSPEAFGCAVIWIFSPFSICQTFHHFSYILLPFFFLLLYIYRVEAAEDGVLTVGQRCFLTGLLIVICLSGEATLPALVTYLLIKLYQRSCTKFILAQLALVPLTLLAHYSLLNSVNNYASSKSRFTTGFTDFKTVLSNLAYFISSIASAIAQGMQLTTISYDPYYPGLPIYSFAWENVSIPFVSVSIAVLACVFCASYAPKGAGAEPRVKFAASAATSPGLEKKTLFPMAIFVLSLWGLYMAMTLAGVKLYGTPYALQIRYGYVVIPATLIALFLLSRRMPAGALSRIVRAASWGIPCIAIVCWLASMLIAAPMNAVQNKKIISNLSEAAKTGIRVVALEHDGFKNDGRNLRPFGITNPFVRWGDSPLQQDWTADWYLNNFLGLQIYRGTIIDWDSRYVLFWHIRGWAALVPKDQVMVVGSESLGSEPLDYPADDVYTKQIKPGSFMTEKRAELLSRPVMIGSDLKLVRVATYARSNQRRGLVFVWKESASKDEIFVHFLDKIGNKVGQGEYAFKKTVPIDNIGILPGNTVRVFVIEMASDRWKDVATVAIGAYQQAAPDHPQVFRVVSEGERDWEDRRLRLHLPGL